MTVDKNRALLRVEEPWHQVDEGALTGAARTDQRDGLPCRYLQRDIHEHRVGAVTEGDAVHLEIAADSRQRTGIRRVIHLDLGEDDLF